MNPGPGGGVIDRPIGGGPGPIRPNPGPLPSRPGGRPNAGNIADHLGGVPLTNNAITELAGSIDRSTLRVAWQAKGSPDALYFESNVDQLTQEESLLNVYDPKTKTMVSWQMMQIDESDLPPQI
jgi:hypothetical protein